MALVESVAAGTNVGMAWNVTAALAQGSEVRVAIGRTPSIGMLVWYCAPKVNNPAAPPALLIWVIVHPVPAVMVWDAVPTAIAWNEMSPGPIGDVGGVAMVPLVAALAWIELKEARMPLTS